MWLLLWLCHWCAIRRNDRKQVLFFRLYLLYSDRFNKTASKKSTQAPKIEPFPVSAFETTIVDFHKLQSLRSSEILNAHRKNGPACSVESNIMCLSQPQMSPLLNTEVSYAFMLQNSQQILFFPKLKKVFLHSVC